MTCHANTIPLGGFFLALVMGCGQSVPNATNGTDATEQPKAKQSPGLEEKVFKTSAELFKSMPRDLHPKPATDTGLEQAATKKWVQENLVGASFEWETKLGGFKAHKPKDREHFIVSFSHTPSNKRYVGTKVAYDRKLDGVNALALDPMKFGELTCEVYLDYTSADKGYDGDGGPRDIMVGEYYRCTEEEAKKLRTFNDTKVALRARIADVRFEMARGYVPIDAPWVDRPVVLSCFVKLHSAAINGYLPKESQPESKKP